MDSAHAVAPIGDDERSCAIVGASGYVGRLLTARLAAEGRRVVAVARHAERLPAAPNVDRRSVDATDAPAMTEVLSGVPLAYYLVHAMAGGKGFAARDRESARGFAAAAAGAGVGRIVYLGALGDERDESPHLASRHEIGEVLREVGIPVVELRAAVVLGAGSISFEMLRYLTERLPVMVCPRWVKSRLQPLGEDDLITYLLRAAEVPSGVYELGSPDVTTYHEMMQIYARVRGLRPRKIVTVPYLTPALSAHWVDLVTPVDRRVSHALVESLRHDVVVHEPAAAAAAFGVSARPVGQAIDAALRHQADAVPGHIFERPVGLSDGIYAMRYTIALSARQASLARRDLRRVGGDLDWYGARWLWRIRMGLGRLAGEQLGLEQPSTLSVGEPVDWWRVAALDEVSLVLASQAWRFGDAWLGFRIGTQSGTGGESIVQVAAFRPRGALGLAYWRALWPVHHLVLRAMVRHRRRRATPRMERTSSRFLPAGLGGSQSR
jgi:uncharacterized protein YbjT (DUF2867 family)